jgi:hypothetical protein
VHGSEPRRRWIERSRFDAPVGGRLERDGEFVESRLYEYEYEYEYEG